MSFDSDIEEVNSPLARANLMDFLLAQLNDDTYLGRELASAIWHSWRG